MDGLFTCEDTRVERALSELTGRPKMEGGFLLGHYGTPRGIHYTQCESIFKEHNMFIVTDFIPVRNAITDPDIAQKRYRPLHWEQVRDIFLALSSGPQYKIAIPFITVSNLYHTHSYAEIRDVLKNHFVEYSMLTYAVLGYNKYAPSTVEGNLYQATLHKDGTWIDRETAHYSTTRYVKSHISKYFREKDEQYD